jgi:uncharacterized protein YggU (UPF0235/DUF167 family)
MEALLRVRLTPKGGHSALIKQEGEVLFARVAEPPVDGAANRALIVLLAKSLDIPKSRIDFHAGETSRDKVLKIEGISPQELQERVQNALRTR